MNWISYHLSKTFLRLFLARGEVNIVGIIGAIILIASVFMFPKMYANFFEYLFDSVFGNEGIFEGKPKVKDGIATPGGK